MPIMIMMVEFIMWVMSLPQNTKSIS